MKNIWSFLLGVLAWETIALRKNPKISEKLKNQHSFTSKIKTVFFELLHLNKKVINDLEDVDYQWNIKDIKAYMQGEIDQIESKISHLTNTITDSISTDHEELLSNLYDKYSQIKEGITKTIQQISKPESKVKKTKKSISSGSKTKKTTSSRKN